MTQRLAVRMSRAGGGDMGSAQNEEMQQKIATARRDAETLKDRIKRRKEELADTTCEC